MKSAHVNKARTMFDKIWERHSIVSLPDGPTLLYIDRDIIHEGSFHAFSQLQNRELSVRRPEQVMGVPDHYVPTRARTAEGAATEEIGQMIRTFDSNMRKSKTQYFPLEDIRQGIVHVVGPEQAFSLPGQIIVCSDSHTSTHGALGAIAFGIGQSENAHVLATQTLWQYRPKVMRLRVTGQLQPGVGAKDLILYIISKIGTAGATGYAIEYDGEVIQSLSLEARLTLCNMSIEAGARCGMVAPDEKTFAYLKGRRWAPKGELWTQAVEDWRSLTSDEGAEFDAYLEIDGHQIAPMVTWGTSPEDALGVDEFIPKLSAYHSEERRKSVADTLIYMGLEQGQPLQDIKIDYVFIGSCTNSRIEDLRAAAEILKGKKAVVPGLVVPGSGLVKAQAEKEGLDQIFIGAGLEWAQPGCSMCVAMNGDIVPAGKRCASTSNRNFRGRQGPGSRTHLMSPAMVAAAAVTGKVTDIRQFIKESSCGHLPH
ncbi:MAG TPA: 3-isopropylmalate dehydratase large subunit [Alcaligenaceae bacterium]|nr:3-isopropylmalate dehydratase large subunit [Alcaligenaceae bacterium]